jgi:hypothetical protein
MKLIFCPECQDVVKLFHDQRFCRCRKSWGRYLTETKAEAGGRAVPLGIANDSFRTALHQRPADGLGARFEAFVIARKCPTVAVKK